MNSTELAREVFRDVVLAISERPHNASLDFVLAPQEDSYFRRPRRANLTRAEMESMGRTGELTALTELWRREDREELLVLVPYLRRIADAVAEERASGASSAEHPSRLIYQMY